MMATVLLFLKANWKPIAILIVILALGAYIETLKLEKNHYEKKADQAIATLNQYKVESKNREDAYAASAHSITAKYAALDTKMTAVEAQNSKLLSERIAQNAELHSVKLSLAAVRLFNESKQTTTTSPAPTTVSGHAADTTTTDTSGAQDGTRDSGLTLTDLFQVSKVNDENHRQCLRVVQKWQNFWKDYQTAVQAAG
ncbi:MAG: hypothetical protein ACYC9R_06485 [Nitrosotalea sp.]